jgi:hypothetical protein
MLPRSLALLFLSLLTPLAAIAEDAATPPTPSVPGADFGSANANTALKIAGLVTFVANSCPDLAPDYDRFKEVISALGLETDDLSKNDLKLKYLNYTALYQADIKGSCEKAQSNFGDAGTVIKGLFHQK